MIPKPQASNRILSRHYVWEFPDAPKYLNSFILIQFIFIVHINAWIFFSSTKLSPFSTKQTKLAKMLRKRKAIALKLNFLSDTERMNLLGLCVTTISLQQAWFPISNNVAYAERCEISQCELILNSPTLVRGV